LDARFAVPLKADDPLLADLRSEPRFIALANRLGLDRFGRGLSPV
jgi:hypothetical protein